MNTNPVIQEGEIILVDKPYRWTSFDVIRSLKKKIIVNKIGHAGTLDPLATGLLLICTEKKTKTITQLQLLEKEYEGEMILGKTTPSVDLETEFDTETDCSFVTIELIKKASIHFLGTIKQIPPAFSAAKIKGVRAYEKARKGEEVKLEPRQVFIKEFVLTKIEIPSIFFRIVCSKGTYIRSLVRDMGDRIGTGAYLNSLRRTRIGNYEVGKAIDIQSYNKKD